MTAPFEDDAPSLFGVIVLFLVLGVIVMPLRVYVRVTNRAFGIDDWLMLAATPFCAGLVVSCIGSSFNGIGVHGSKLEPEQQNRALLWFFLFSCFWCISVTLVKLSIAFMLARIADVKKKYTYSLYGISAVVAITNGIAFFYIIFRCSPVSAAWDTSLMVSKCEPAATLTDIYYASTAVNIATDWFCAILPIFLLWRVQLNTRSKISVMVLLGLGVLASITACVRLHYEVLLETSTDYFFAYGMLMLWGYAEVGIGYFVGCLSTLRPLISRNTETSDRKQPWVHATPATYEFSTRSRVGRTTTVSSEEELVDNKIHVVKSLRQSSTHSLVRKASS